MTRYGYKISGLARGERFFETERLLDIVLKGFEKLPASFEEDGSRKQEYIKKDDEGEKNVTLIKNVTESGILVFSDIPLKLFRFGGAVFYLWDILPTLVMGILWWFVYPKFIPRIARSNISAAAVQAGVGLAFWFLSGAAGALSGKFEGMTRRHLRILFVPLRTSLRREFIARGGAFTAVCLFISGFSLFKGWDLSYLLYRLLLSPIPTLIFSVIPWAARRRR